MPIACQLHAPSKLATSVALCCVVKLHILEWPFIVASLKHTCAIIMLSNQHLDMPHLWGGWIISAKVKCSITQIYTNLWTIFERNRPFVYIKKILRSLSSAHEKWGQKQKCCVYNFVQCVYIYIYIYIYIAAQRLWVRFPENTYTDNTNV